MLLSTARRVSMVGVVFTYDKKNRTIAIQSPADDEDALEVANLRQTVKPQGNELVAATIPSIVERFIPMEPASSNSSLNDIMGSDEDQIVSSTVQQKPSNQPTPSTLLNNVAVVHIEEHHVIDIPLERDGTLLIPHDLSMWDDEPREVDIETPVESRRVSPQGSRVPSYASARAPTPVCSRNVSPALSLTSSPVTSIPNSPRDRPITNPYLPTIAPTDAVLSSLAENSFSGKSESHPPFLSTIVPLVSQRTMLPPLAIPMQICPSVISPPSTSPHHSPIALKTPLPTGSPPPVVNPQLAVWIAQARVWKEMYAEDAGGASFYYKETTQESQWEVPTSQGYTREDTRLVLLDGTVFDDPTTVTTLEVSTTVVVSSDQ